MNRFDIIGNLGAAPQIAEKTRQNGEVFKYARLSVAVNTYQGKDKPPRTDWFDVAIFNDVLVRLAEQNMAKGDKIFISGEMVRSTQTIADKKYTLTNYRVGYEGRIELLSPKGESSTSSANEAAHDDLPASDPDDE